jgi:hypothetical protein
MDSKWESLNLVLNEHHRLCQKIWFPLPRLRLEHCPNLPLLFPATGTLSLHICLAFVEDKEIRCPNFLSFGFGSYSRKIVPECLSMDGRVSTTTMGLTLLHWCCCLIIRSCLSLEMERAANGSASSIDTCATLCSIRCKVGRHFVDALAADQVSRLASYFCTPLSSSCKP